MKLLLVLLVMVSSAAVAGPFYEPFSYEPGLLPGAGQWTGEEAKGSLAVMPGSLKYDGLAPSQKNRVKLPSTRSKVIESSRPVDPAVASPWFSLILRMDSTEGLGASKDGKPMPFGFFRFGTSGGANGPGLYLHPVPGGSSDSFQLLISKRANPGKVVVAGTALKTGVPHLIVGRYDASVTPHALKLWIDPAPESLGAETAPEPSAQAAEGHDLTANPDLLILGGGVGSPGLMVDEIRVGESWADVTPTN